MTKRMMIVTSVLAGLTALFWASFLDETLSQWVYQLRLPVLTKLMEAFSWLGYVYFLVPINLLILIVLFRPDRRLALAIPLGTLAIWRLSEWLKTLIERPRPDLSPIAIETSYSFPSGHAMSNTAFYLLLMLIAPTNKYWRRFCISMIVIIGFSRVYLGVHWPSDVFGGTAIAMILVHLIYQLIARRPESVPDKPRLTN